MCTAGPQILEPLNQPTSHAGLALLLEASYQRERRRLAAERKAAFCEPPTGPNQVWQFDFSEYETSRGGTWRTAEVADYWSKV